MKKWTDAAMDKILVIARICATRHVALHLGRHGPRHRRRRFVRARHDEWQLLTDNILKGDTTIYNKRRHPRVGKGGYLSLLLRSNRRSS
jgi:hypothetical protein